MQFQIYTSSFTQYRSLIPVGNHNPIPFESDMFQSIHDNGGRMSRAQLHSMFYSDRKWSKHVRRRLQHLVEAHYLNCIDEREYVNFSIPRTGVYALGWRGIVDVIGRSELGLDIPAKPSSYWQQRLAKRVKDLGFFWSPKIPTSNLPHDIQVVEIKRKLEHDLGQIDHLELGEVLFENYFKRHNEPIYFKRINEEGEWRWASKAKQVNPDLGFAVHNTDRATSKGWLLDFESGRGDDRFGKYKAAPSAWYIKNDQNKQWLWIIDGGMRKLTNRIAQALYHGRSTASRKFLFATLHQFMASSNAYTSSIWFRPPDPPENQEEQAASRIRDQIELPQPTSLIKI